MNEQHHLIGGTWQAGAGRGLASWNPATGAEVWSGREASAGQVDQAVMAARTAFRDWADRDLEARSAVLQAFGQALWARREPLARCISNETGKPAWEAAAEVGSMIDKIAISLRAYQERTGERRGEAPQAVSIVRHRPHGVAAVFGPFNLPGHLPNGHIVPALLAGNTVVFKPSELAPAVAELTVRCWLEAGLPEGVVNLAQGGHDTGFHLAGHPNIDALFFTGSPATGHALHRQFAGHPAKLLALEMGGNNPLVVSRTGDPRAAALLTVQSAYVTAGQRCTCARRLIVVDGGEGERYLEALAATIGRVRVGPPDDRPEPFMGPLINEAAVTAALSVQDTLLAQGGREIVAMRRLSEERPFLAPGLIDVTPVSDRPDKEVFAPLLQLVRCPDLEAAIVEANRTVYGLAAGLFSDDAGEFDRFFRASRAGIVNWNRPLTGASSAAPFGGIGESGNHRPSAYYAADYCAYPVATLASDRVAMPEHLPPGLDA